MQRLIDGYARFRAKVYPQHSKLFERLAKGQQPQALFICCSDSRVMPEMMMQCDPGDLFPCRNAGNLVPPATETNSGVAATVEYAIRVLKVADVVVCGHSDCGAMKAILEKEQLESLPIVRSWLEHAGPSSKWLTRTLKGATSMTFEERLQAVTEANVIAQMQNLKTHPAVDEALKKGTIGLHGWMYDIASGNIRRFDPQLGAFCALLADGPSSAPVEAKQELKIA
ncbi:carbonic anhydrase [Edaphobacter aggregans]|uniref:carbonic anhydrase n=1 Tax=Edaphobacter aggregans TaxID=570835 RepID=UPI0005569E61|nr:carbonic anhydrase [Edaphobacter aggregans]